MLPVYQSVPFSQSVYQEDPIKQSVYHMEPPTHSVYQPETLQRSVYQPKSFKQSVYQSEPFLQSVYQPKPVTYVIQDVYHEDDVPSRVLIQENVREKIYQQGQHAIPDTVLRHNIYQADFYGPDKQETGYVTYIRQGADETGRTTVIVKDLYTSS